VILLTQTAEERVGAVVISGPREGEVVLLDPDVISQAPSAHEMESITTLNSALDDLNAALDRFLVALKASADDYAAASARLEGTG
jgi:hypothetical protein